MWTMDYDEAARYWEEKDRDSAHMEHQALKARIEEFITANNTCALATASADGDFVRNTPIEYNFLDGWFYFLSEGGLKFRALKENENVGIAIYESYGGFGKLKGLQVTGTAEMVEPFSAEYLRVLEFKKIPEDAMRKLPHAMHLIKVAPAAYDYLDSALKKEGFAIRQHLEV